MRYQTKRVLITAKAYPNPSKKYQETVCCAGVDMESKEWIRLYPVPFRDLDEDQRFKKYNIIEVRCRKSNTDHRRESYKIQADTIRIVGYLDTSRRWLKRKELIIPFASRSFCEILALGGQRCSLGMFQPADVDFSWQKAGPVNQDQINACYAQLTFFNKKKEAIETIPYDFYYSFCCANEAKCPGHRLMIIDWELGQAYRKWRRRYAEDELMRQMRKQWLNTICGKDKDTYFYVGNMHRFAEQFLVLGVFWPPQAHSSPNLFNT